MTAGIAALVIQRNSWMPFFPEAVKAVILASADCDVDNVVLDLNDGWDDKDGAGVPNALEATEVANPAVYLPATHSNRGHFYGYMDFANPNQWSKDFFTTQGLARTTSSGWLRAALTWDSTGTCTDPLDATSCSPAGPDHDLALLVFDVGMTTLVAWSDSPVDNYEVVIDELAPNTDYRLVIAKAGSPPRHPYTFYGIAWTTQDDVCSP